jgi:hypothetical protein
MAWKSIIVTDQKAGLLMYHGYPKEIGGHFQKLPALMNHHSL